MSSDMIPAPSDDDQSQTSQKLNRGKVLPARGLGFLRPTAADFDVLGALAAAVEDPDLGRPVE